MPKQVVEAKQSKLPNFPLILMMTYDDKSNYVMNMREICNPFFVTRFFEVFATDTKE